SPQASGARPAGRRLTARRVRAFTPLRARIFHRALAAAVSDCHSVLDVGCGIASPLAAVRFRGFSVGVDLSAAALRAAREAHTHAALVRADATDVARIFRPASVDAVVALDVIEHLERDAALALVDALERVA